MKLIYSPRSSPIPETGLIGGKAKVLFDLYRDNYPVPEPLCISTDAYLYFVQTGELLEKINLEVNRKNFEEMRWEEIWDAALRIKSHFLNHPFPDDLEALILETLARAFGDIPLVIRSSAPEEDSGATSFAGLHDSYVGISGDIEILAAIKKVWASLWSDRALLYRQELGLDIATSSMAVLIQCLEEGISSGVAFSCNPLDDSQLVIEAVYGLNTGLVDGTIEPDRWLVDRGSLKIVEHVPPQGGRFQMKRATDGTISRLAIHAGSALDAQLDATQVESLSRLVLDMENRFCAAQDIEWTLSEDRFWLLQARPVTATHSDQSVDKRAWYLSLHRSYDNLLELWNEIENILLPDMDRDSDRLAAVDLTVLSNHACGDDLQHRLERSNHWTGVYWSTFIPFAHGVRLFGEVYNETIHPDDPFEFVSLLSGESILGVKRNELLVDCARRMGDDPLLNSLVMRGKFAEIDDPEFLQNITLLEQYYGLSLTELGGQQASFSSLTPALLGQYKNIERHPLKAGSRRSDLEQLFIRKVQEDNRFDPLELLALARASYRLRDDDNIHIGRIAAQLDRATAHSRERLARQGINCADGSVENMIKAFHGEQLPTDKDDISERPVNVPSHTRLKARQLLGQPASAGLSKGKARVIHSQADLSEFQKGEILVCDAIDPTITFFAPLAAGILEKRGGMLIHGAIIAREYGIPCVTGIPDVTLFIQTGDTVTIDGYLGIVTRES